jgi:hypothetical protein
VDLKYTPTEWNGPNRISVSQLTPVEPINGVDSFL